MLQVARLAPALLGEAGELVEKFVRSQQGDDGGFFDRDGKSDLYYTSFAIDALTALQAELPVEQVRGYLEAFGSGERLDFVHLCCLARCWSAIEKGRAGIGEIFDRLENYRAGDGGYNQSPDSSYGSAYGSFLAYGAYSDHGRMPPEELRILDSLQGLADDDGSWTNDRELPITTVPATGAAVTLLRNFRAPVPEATGPWLLSSTHPGGGFKAFPEAPMPDLLSTAVALHALDGLQVSFGPYREACLDFVDTLWTADGGFHGNWDDDVLDIEYTYYGLLALGHLSFE
jgi:prenyltransferase beta subunit